MPVAIAREPRTSPLMLLHAVILTVGVFSLPASVFGRSPHFMLLAGSCFLIVAALTAVGIRAAFAGPSGSAFRNLLGPARVATLYLRIAFWLLVGVLATAWGATRILEHEPHAPWPHDLVIGCALART